MSPLSTKQTAWRFSRSATDTADPGILRQRARTFASTAATTKGGATLLVVAAENKQVDRFLIAGPSGEGAAKRAAAVVGANVERVDELPELHTDVVMVATARRGSMSANETQSGSDISVVSETFIAGAAPNSWMAIRFTKPTARQHKANKDWRTGIGTHHSFEGEAMLATITAGGDDRDDVERMMNQVIAAMPGFDVQIKTRQIGLGPLTIGSGLLAAGAYAALAFTGSLVDGGAYALAPALLFAAGASGHGFTARDHMARLIDNGIFPRAGSRAARSQTNRQTGEVKQADYPFDRNAFLLGPDVAIGLITASASGSTDAATTSHRGFPKVLTERKGPPFAHTKDNDHEIMAYLSAADLYGGIAAVGRPGSGKSVFVRTVFGWVIADKVRRSNLEGATGANTSIAVYETKGEGADYYEHWAAMAGTTLLRMDVADSSTPAIDMFPGDGTYVQRSRLFVEAMRYAFPEGSIEARSTETLVSIFAAALWITENGGVDAPGLEDASVIKLAHVLLGANGDDNALALAQHVRDKAGKDHEVWLALGPLFGSATPANRRTLSESPRNKVDAMFGIDMWFDAKRARKSWSQLIDSHESVVLNLGTGSNGAQVSEAQVTLMSSMLVYLMQAAIRSTCSGWQDKGRSLYVFADELSSLAGGSPEIIDWLREKGRSYGVRNVFATQRMNQLHPILRESLAGYATMAWFAQDVVDVANAAATDLSLGGAEWSPSDVVNLPNHTAAMRTTANGQRQVAFTAPIIYYEAPLGTTWDAQAWLKAVALDKNEIIEAHPSRDWTKRMSSDASETVSLDKPSGGATIVDDEPAVSEMPSASNEPTDVDPFDPMRFEKTEGASSENDF